jgi:hypothetical protein
MNVGERELQWFGWRRLAAGMLALAAVGCGAREQEQLAPVTGVVLLDGKPLHSGSVITMPERGRGAKGTIDERGRFSLATRGLGEGAVVGPHQVAVVAYENAASTGVNPEAQIKLTIPARYAQASSSGLTIDVKPGEANEVTFELSSQADR